MNWWFIQLNVNNQQLKMCTKHSQVNTKISNEPWGLWPLSIFRRGNERECDWNRFLNELFAHRPLGVSYRRCVWKSFRQRIFSNPLLLKPPPDRPQPSAWVPADDLKRQFEVFFLIHMKGRWEMKECEEEKGEILKAFLHKEQMGPWIWQQRYFRKLT